MQNSHESKIGDEIGNGMFSSFIHVQLDWLSVQTQKIGLRVSLMYSTALTIDKLNQSQY